MYVRCYSSIAKHRSQLIHHWTRHNWIYIGCLFCRSEGFVGAFIWHTLGLTRRDQTPVMLPRWRLSSYQIDDRSGERRGPRPSQFRIKITWRYHGAFDLLISIGEFIPGCLNSSLNRPTFATFQFPMQSLMERRLYSRTTFRALARYTGRGRLDG